MNLDCIPREELQGILCAMPKAELHIHIEGSHGVHCLDDPGLVKKLALQKIPLTVCPLSNVKLHVFPSLASHNLGRLLTAGIAATVNSDDPAYFGGYLN